MSKRQVTPEVLMNAIRAQARDVAPRVEEFASTAESAKNRLANAKFAEEMQRTIDDEMVPSIKRFTAAQQESLYPLSCGPRFLPHVVCV